MYTNGTSFTRLCPVCPTDLELNLSGLVRDVHQVGQPSVKVTHWNELDRTVEVWWKKTEACPVFVNMYHVTDDLAPLN